MEFRQEKARGVEEARFCRKMQNQLELKLIYMGGHEQREDPAIISAAGLSGENTEELWEKGV